MTTLLSLGELKCKTQRQRHRKFSKYWYKQEITPTHLSIYDSVGGASRQKWLNISPQFSPLSTKIINHSLQDGFWSGFLFVIKFPRCCLPQRKVQDVTCTCRMYYLHNVHFIIYIEAVERLWLHKFQSPPLERTHMWFFLIKLSRFNLQLCSAVMLTAVALWLRISNATGSTWLWADFDADPRGTEFPSLRREIRCFIIGK